MKCAEHVRCAKCEAPGIEARHFPRYIEFYCPTCGYVWSVK